MLTFYGSRPWKTAIDNRVRAGKDLGLKFLNQLRSDYNRSSQYTLNWSHIADHVNRMGYQIGSEAAKKMRAEMPNETSTKIYVGQAYAMPDNMRITDSVGGAAGSGRLVKATSAAPSNSQVPSVAIRIQRPNTQQPDTGYRPRPLPGLGGGGGSGDGGGGGSGTPNPTNPTTTPTDAINDALKFGPGGPSSMLGGNASGFRRKRSSAQASGLSRRGTSQFKITGQTGRSSGLNIGV